MSKPPPSTLAAPTTGEPLWSGAGDVPEAPAPEGERYEVLRELARGGLGRILEANDRVLKRPVALKELIRDTPGNRLRFQREILFTARLQHPAIVPLYEAVQGPDGRQRYAMKLVSGTTLDEAVAAASTPEARLALLPHVLAVADAVAYAHARGVIHRDLKPQNILVGTFGETVLIDWGVAKDLGVADLAGDTADGDDDAALTRAGTVVGTPAYMAPEQARGEPADPRADVYSLGATLYHVLSGEPPFPGDARTTLDALRAGGGPEPLETRAIGVPPDLLSIVRRAMAPRPDDRYASGQELRQDLLRFSTGQLVAARTYTRADRLRRWLAANRQLVIVVAGALVTLGVMGGVSAREVVAERDEAEAARGVAEARSNALTLAHARSSVESDPTEAAMWLATYPLDGADWDEVFAVAQEVESRGVASVFVQPPGEACDEVIFSADGGWVLRGGADVQPLDVATGQVHGRVALARLYALAPVSAEYSIAADSVGRIARIDRSGGTHVLGTIASMPTGLATDGTVAVVGDRGGKVTSFDLRSGATRTLLAVGARVSAVAVHEGRWVASTADGELFAGPLSGDAPRLLATRPSAIEALAIAADGAAIVGEFSGEVTLLPLAGEARSLLRLPAAVSAVASSADGRLVAAADTTSALRVFDRSDGTVRTPPWTPSRAFGVAFSPSAPLLAATLQDGSVRFWQPLSGTTDARRSTARVTGSPAFSPDGEALATCAMDGSLRVWPLPPMDGERFLGHESRVFHPVFLPDGRVVTDGDDHTVRIWSPGRVAGTVLRGHTDRTYGLAVNPDATRVVSAGTDGLAIAWDLDTGRATVLRGHDGRVQRALFRADGETVVTAGRDGTLRTWAADGSPIATVQAHTGAAWWATLSADGRAVYSVGADRALRRWGLDDGVLETVLEPLGPADGRTLRTHLLSEGRVLTCAEDDTLVVIGAGPPRRYVLPQEVGCPSIVVSPDGHTAAIVNGGHVGLFDADDGTWRPLVTFDAECHSVAWSPDGRLVAAALLDGTARIWRPEDGAVYIAHRTESAALGVAFSPDGQRLAVVGVDPAVWVGPVEEARLLPPEPAALHARLGSLTTARLPEP